MYGEQSRRPKRNPLSPEEVAEIIALRKKREHVRLLKLKQSRSYKVMNIFNIACFCVYLELLLCFFGPAITESHYATRIVTNYQARHAGDAQISDIDVVTSGGRKFNFVVNDSIHVPPVQGSFLVGKDYLLRKELKGIFEGSETWLRLFSATPVLVLCMLIGVMSVVAYSNNLNENAYSLMAITVMNALTLLGVVLL